MLPPTPVFASFLRKNFFSSLQINSFSSAAPKAAALIIGTEILTGKTHDKNSFVLSKLLFAKGIDLVRIETIHDDIDLIAQSVRSLSNLVGSNGYVFTSGGIGPTHDDVTYEGVAKAFGKGVELHQTTYNAMLEYFEKKGTLMNEARKRMAILPVGARIVGTSMNWIPLAALENVYILPGIPSLFESMLNDMEKDLHGVSQYRKLVKTMKSEGDIAEILKQEQRKNKELIIGSYPRVDGNNKEYHVKVSIEGRNKKQVEETAKRIERAIDGY